MNRIELGRILGLVLAFAGLFVIYLQEPPLASKIALVVALFGVGLYGLCEGALRAVDLLREVQDGP